MTEGRDISTIMEGLNFVLTDKELASDYKALKEKVTGIQEQLSAGKLDAKDAPGVAIDMLTDALELAVRAAKNASDKAKKATDRQTQTQTALVQAQAEKVERQKRRKELEQHPGGAYAADLLLPR